MLSHALQLAAEGWRVFPLSGKAPALSRDEAPGGFRIATSDPAQIREWWTRFPTANIGIAIPEGLAVVDVDPRNGGTLEALPEGPVTRVARTGGGGWHIWFQLDPETALPGRLGPGIDTKNGGRGYVVAPGSIHPETRQPYVWENDAPIAPAPPWLVERARARPRVTSESVAADLEASERTQSDDTIRTLAALLEPHFIEGQRHHLAKNLGGWLKQRGWSAADVEAVIRELPSKDPDGRVRAAVAAYQIAQPYGWTELCDLLGEEHARQIDAWCPNPSKAFADAVQQVNARAMAERARPDWLRKDWTTRYLLEQNTAPPPIRSGVAPLDALLRGGLRFGRVTVLGGAPGAGKTSLARQLADHMAKNGVAVGWYAADEGLEGLAQRRLQALGLSRDDTEKVEGRPITEATIARSRAALDPLPFELFDVTVCTLEDVFEVLARLYPDRPRVVIIDSIQTARTSRSAGLETKPRIDDVVFTMKHLARGESGAAVVALSELGRASYRSQASASAVDDLAAFKETGAIEYQADTLLVMRSIAGTGEVVSVTVPKNRVGPKEDFLLRFDRETTDFFPTDEDPRTVALQDVAQEKKEAVFQVVARAVWPGALMRDFRGCGTRLETVGAALELLAREGRILICDDYGNQLPEADRVRVKKKRYRVPECAPRAPDSPTAQAQDFERMIHAYPTP